MAHVCLSLLSPAHPLRHPTHDRRNRPAVAATRPRAARARTPLFILHVATPRTTTLRWFSPKKVCKYHTAPSFLDLLFAQADRSTADHTGFGRNATAITTLQWAPPSPIFCPFFYRVSLPLVSPVLKESVATVAFHQSKSTAPEMSPPRPPRRGPPLLVSFHRLDHAWRHPRGSLMLAGRTSPLADHHNAGGLCATAPPRAGTLWWSHPRGAVGTGQLASLSPMGWVGVARPWARFWPRTIHSFSFSRILIFNYKFQKFV
jgi:hypothetical protein